MKLLFTILLVSVAIQSVFSWGWCFPWRRHNDNYYKISIKNAMKVTSSEKSVIDSLKRERDNKNWFWCCWNWITDCLKSEICEGMRAKYTVRDLKLKIGKDTSENNKTSFPIDLEMSVMGKVDDMKNLGKNLKEIKFDDVDDADVVVGDAAVIRIENCNKIKEEGRELYNCKDDLKTTKKP